MVCVRVISTRASDSSVISTRERELLPREGKGTREIGVLSKNSELFPWGGWVDDGSRYFPGRVSGGSRYFPGRVSGGQEVFHTEGRGGA